VAWLLELNAMHNGHHHFGEVKARRWVFEVISAASTVWLYKA
jgi:hypothetical protein